MRIRIKASIKRLKTFKKWASHLQIDADPDLSYHLYKRIRIQLSLWCGSRSSYHSDADPGPTFNFDAEPDQQQHWFDDVPLGVDVGKIAWLGGEGLLDASLLEQEGGVVADDRPGNVGWNHFFTWKHIKNVIFIFGRLISQKFKMAETIFLPGNTLKM